MLFRSRTNLLADALAVIERHAALAVDVQPQNTSTPQMHVHVRELETHGLDRGLENPEQTLFVDRLTHQLRARHGLTEKKNGPTAH